MSRISQAGSAAQPHVEAPEQPAAAPPASPSKIAPKGQDGSRIETYGGSAEPRAGADRPLEPTYQQVKQQLSWSLTNWSLSEGEVARTHALLSRLGFDDYRAAIGRLHSDGLLERYLGAMSPKAQAAFLEQAQAKGLVLSEPGKKAPAGVGNPPDGPALFRNERDLPEPLRKLLHDTNAAAARAYRAAHEQYLDRYIGLVGQTGNGLDVLVLGEPTAPLSLSEPGVDFKHPDAKAFGAHWARNVPGTDNRFRAYEAVRRRMYELTNRAMPGDVWLKGQVKVMFGELVKVGWAKETVVNQRGAVFTKAKAVAEAGDSHFKVTGAIGEDGRGTMGVSVGPVSVGSDGSFRLTARGPVNAYAEVTKDGFGGGLSKDFKAGSVTMSASLGVGGSKAQPKNAPQQTGADHFFSCLEAYRAGLEWSTLSTVQRQQLEVGGVTGELWNLAIAARDRA